MNVPARVWPATLAALSCLLALPSCGYVFLRPHAPFGVERVALVAFDEDSPAGLAPLLADAVAHELVRGGVRLTLDAVQASAVLTGRITEVAMVASPTSGERAPTPSYTVRATVQATLRDPRSKVLWTSTVSAEEDFLPPTAPNPEEAPPDVISRWESSRALVTEGNRRTALHRLAQTVARSLYQDLLLASALTPKGQS